MSDPYESALNFLDSIRDNLPEDYRPYLQRLQQPQNLVQGDLEVKMDDGSMQKFRAYRFQHNNALGPYKGGIRFHKQVSESEVKALGLWMALKTSIAGIPYGGGKGGVVIDPAQLSQKELENVSRAYMRLVAQHIGPDRDIPAPDVNTDSQVMAWMLDEYEKILKHHAPAVITGKPIELGGSAGRTKATGYGGVLALHFLKKACADAYPDNTNGWYHKKRADITIAVQGFGNVGYYFAQTAASEGYRVVAVSDSKGGIYAENGLDPQAVLQSKEKNGSVTAYTVGSAIITNEELLKLNVDIIVPSALEGAIHADNADHIQAPVIIEMANGPITSEADDILSKKDMLTVPDIFANAGGVIVSYLEWVQNRTGLYWKEHEVDQKLEELMQKAFDVMWGKHLELKDSQGSATLRMAAYVLAVERIIKAEMLRRPL
ncbi:hypothetical protein A3D08_03000 [Candidatus Roizmanbacteria bacterium RIFCSPHIGHO2_02_FULL_43_11]|uniref:Glutamate dehydrogenase n=1 Tax=Candidatus Roizmanbacteria bacterium RIFCSPHIGHO2_02_FULL_43_11 TaxID=1802043 RepID=A0A1F7HKJ8_9BACT|nr:MAG: hypothetical protein A3D08_03000 [Candidatus Roizmanbacteria bacterium RIFCSPHIGHO2_02_FULL_43_11]